MLTVVSIMRAWVRPLTPRSHQSETLGGGEWPCAHAAARMHARPLMPVSLSLSLSSRSQAAARGFFVGDREDFALREFAATASPGLDCPSTESTINKGK